MRKSYSSAVADKVKKVETTVVKPMTLSGRLNENHDVKKSFCFQGVLEDLKKSEIENLVLEHDEVNSLMRVIVAKPNVTHLRELDKFEETRKKARTMLVTSLELDVSRK